MSARQPSTPPEIEGFRYIQLLGMGGFADVFQYEQLALRRTVGVKVLLTDLGRGAQQSFEAEANLMAQLSNHPSIVSIYQAGAAPDGRAFLVMEYCPPPHLAVRIKSQPLTVAKALEIGVQIASAVETAHRLGIVHRDIKPANILFTEYGRPALTDFGISATFGDEQSRAQGMSLPWAPPEQLSSNHELTPVSDVYSLAATLWTTLVSRSPFEVKGGPNDGHSMSRRIRSETPPATGRQDVPESLERVLRMGMAKKPDLRYGSALEFARALQSVQAELHQSVTPVDVREDRAPEDVLATRDDTGTVLDNFVAIDPDVATGPTATRTSTQWPTASSDLTSTELTGTAPVRDSFIDPSARTAPSARQRTTGTAAQPTPSARQFPSLPPLHGAVEDTVVTGPHIEEVDAEPAQVETPQRSRTSRKGWLAAAIALIVLVAGIVVANALLRDAPSAAKQTSSPSVQSKPADPVGKPPTKPKAPTGVVAGDKVTFTWTNPDPEAGDTYLYRVEDPKAKNPVLAVKEPTVTVDKVDGQTCLIVRVVRGTSKQISDWSPAGCVS